MSAWSVTSAVFDVYADVTKMSLAILPSALNASGVWMSALHTWGHHTAWRYGQDLERNVTRTLMHFSPSIFLLFLLSLFLKDIIQSCTAPSVRNKFQWLLTSPMAQAKTTLCFAESCVHCRRTATYFVKRNRFVTTLRPDGRLVERAASN